MTRSLCQHNSMFHIGNSLKLTHFVIVWISNFYKQLHLRLWAQGLHETFECSLWSLYKHREKVHGRFIRQRAKQDLSTK